MTMNLNRIAATTVLLLAGTLQGWGATINSDTQSFDFFGTSQTLNFTQFDPSLGTLTLVRMTLLPRSRMTVTGTPTDPYSGGCGGDYSASVSAVAGGASFVVAQVAGQLTSGTCGTSDFDIDSFSNIPRTISNQSNLNVFSGIGTVEVTLSRTSSVTNIRAASFTTEGTAMLTYIYDPAPVAEVPEPATASLIAAGLTSAAFLSRRRRRES